MMINKTLLYTGDITYITSFEVWVLDIRFITPQVSPSGPGIVIYVHIHAHMGIDTDTHHTQSAHTDSAFLSHMETDTVGSSWGTPSSETVRGQVSLVMFIHNQQHTFIYIIIHTVRIHTYGTHTSQVHIRYIHTHTLNTCTSLNTQIEFSTPHQ